MQAAGGTHFVEQAPLNHHPARQGQKPHLLFLITEDWYFRTHRLTLAKEAQKAGMDVTVVTVAEDKGKWIRDEGFSYRLIPFIKASRNPLRELCAVLKLAKLYRQEKPDVVHHVAIKPVLYGSLAARLAGVRGVVNAFGGLGYVFTAATLKGRVFRTVLKRALRTALALPRSRVVVQTLDDRARLIHENLVRQDQTVVIRGVGVDVDAFSVDADQEDIPLVVLACRMLWDKGVGDFVRAAALLKEQGIKARFVLVGRTDLAAPHAITDEQLAAWQRDGVVEWWGHRDDMPQILAAAAVVTLPTFYGEGVPKILLEACASAKPIITTPLPGCKEVVKDGENGFLIPPKNPHALADKIKVLLDNRILREAMGQRGRDIARREFTAEEMARRTLAIYRDLLHAA